MRDETRKLIRDLDYRQVSDILQIIIALQEEDDVWNKVGFKNGFKLFRNLCAHTPSDVISKLNSIRGTGVDKVFYPKGDREIVSISTMDILVCLLKMYILSKDEHYKIFAYKFMCLIYGENYSCIVYDFPVIQKRAVLSIFFVLQESSWKRYSYPKTVVMEDTWMVEVCRTNEKLFWRIAIPSFTLLLTNYLMHVGRQACMGQCTDDFYAEFICTIYERMNM